MELKEYDVRLPKNFTIQHGEFSISTLSVLLPEGGTYTPTKLTAVDSCTYCLEGAFNTYRVNEPHEFWVRFTCERSSNLEEVTVESKQTYANMSDKYTPPSDRVHAQVSDFTVDYPRGMGRVIIAEVEWSEDEENNSMSDRHKVHVQIKLKDPEGKFFPRIPEFLEAIEHHYEKDVPFDLSLGWPYTHLEQIQRPHFFFSEDFKDEEWFYELLTTEVDRKKLELHREGKVYPDCLQAFFTLVSPFLVAEEGQLLAVWAHEDDDFDDRLTYAYVYRGGLACEVKVPDEPPVKREPVFLGFLGTPPRTVGGIDFIALTVEGEWERLQELLKTTPVINSFGLKEKE